MLKFVSESEWYVIASIDPYEGRCEECDGTGKVKCDSCEGTCEIECYACSHVEDCEDCDGGYNICDMCNGADFISSYQERITYDKEAYERYKNGLLAYSPHEMGG